MTPQTTHLSMSALAMSAVLLFSGQVFAAPAGAPVRELGTCAKGYTCIDFSGTTYSFEAFEGLISAEQAKDPKKKNKPNKVAKYVKGPTGAPWAGATIYSNVADKSVKPFGLDKSLIVTVRAYSEAAGQTTRLKVEAANDPGVTLETDAVSTVAGAWETLTFDLSKPAPGTPAWNPAKTYNKVSLFPQFSVSSPPPQDTTTYYDDITYRTGKAGGGGGGSLIFSSNYGDTGTGWVSVEGGTAGNYIDDSVATLLWWRGVAPNDATPSFYFGYGINVNAKPWGFGAFVNAPGNGTAKVSGYTGVKIAVWGNDELMNTHPTLTLLLVGPVINGCAAAVQGLMPVSAPGVQTYTVAYTGMTLATPCGFATVKDALAAGVNAVNVQVLGSNVQYQAGGDGQGNYPNGLNVGPISFN